MKVKIYGASDDLIELEVIGADDVMRRDEIGAYCGDRTLLGHLTISTVGGARAVKVHVVYDGCWSFAVGQIEDERSLPPWMFEIGPSDTPYSTALTISTGDDIVVIEWDRAK